MIVAGIDEAGLGPALGPLCTCGAAFRLPDGAGPDAPWEIFSALLSRHCRGALPAVADSKAVYAARGLAGLELPVLAFLQAQRRGAALPPDRATFLRALGCPLPSADLPPWYAEDWAFPAAAPAAAVAALAAAIQETPQARLLAFSARARTAKALNRDFAKGRNKAEAAWQSVASLLREFAALATGQEETLIVIDKQGGRHFYAALLGETFDCPLVATRREGPGGSEYQIGHCRFLFVPRGEQAAFPVALASMLAKYLRERFMAGLNRWFAARLPGLAPTAGYHGDAPRYYEAVKPVLRAEGIAVGDFWRLR